MVSSKMCECGSMTDEKCQCAFFDGEPWTDFDEELIDYDDDIDWGEEGEAPLPNTEPA